MNKIKKIFKVLITDTLYDVYDIEDKEHEGINGEPKTWWLYFDSPLPEGCTPPIDSDKWHPWHISIQRLVWDIHIKQSTTTKEKYDSIHFRNHTNVEMRCNGILVYSFGTGGEHYFAYAMAKIQYLQVELAEHCYNFFNPGEEKGRKIYWHGLPATIMPRKHSGWEIDIYPDYTTGLTKEKWWDELRKRETMIGKKPDEDDEIESEDRKVYEEMGYIPWGDALSDQYINWFRQ